MTDNHLHSSDVISAKLELEVSHIIKNAEKTSKHLQKISDIVTRIDFRMNDYLMFKESTDKRFEKNEKMISDILDVIKYQKLLFKSMKWVGGILTTFIIFITSMGFSVYNEIKFLKEGTEITEERHK